MTQGDVDNISRSVPGIKTISPFMSSMAQIVHGTKSTSVSLLGQSANYRFIQQPLIYEGRYINEQDDQEERKVCVLGKKVAGDLFGFESPVGKYVAISGIYYKVVGVAGQRGEVNIGGRTDESVIIPSSTMRRAYNMGDKIFGCLLLFEDNIVAKSVLPKIERVLYRNHTIHPDDHNALFFFDVSEQFSMVDNLFIGISLLALFVGCGSLLAGIIGVGNIMWVIVKERTQEIGIRRAIGATPADIITQILSEGVMLTFIAGFAGICFAVGGLEIAQLLTRDEFFTPRFQLTFNQAMSIVIVFVILGTAAGFVPARKAMKIKPVEAMRSGN